MFHTERKRAKIREVFLHKCPLQVDIKKATDDGRAKITRNFVFLRWFGISFNSELMIETYR